MSNISAIGAQALNRAAAHRSQDAHGQAADGASQAAKDPKSEKLKQDAAKVGRDFEAILVRQMLATTKVAGKGGGYEDMAVEALATSITSAGGLGMGRAIEQALSRVAHVAPANDTSLPKPPQK